MKRKHFARAALLGEITTLSPGCSFSFDRTANLLKDDFEKSATTFVIATRQVRNEPFNDVLMVSNS